MAELMFIVEKDGDNAILRASQCPDFASFLAAIRSKFTDLLSDDFPLKFVLEPKQLSSVKSQEDFENVILLCKNLQRCVVNLTIVGYVSTGNSGATARKENAPTEGQNGKRKLPEEERNEGECVASPIPVCDFAPKQDSRSLQKAPTEVNRSKRKLPWEEEDEGDCAISPVSICDVASEEDSGSPLNAPSKGKKSKRKLSEEERNGGDCETSSLPPYNIAPEQDSGSLRTAPTEKQKSMRNIPAEERNQGECATLAITHDEVSPQQDSRSLVNASSEKQKSKLRKLLEENTNEVECLTSPTTLSIAAPQQGGRSLLNADWVNKITHVGQEFRGGVADFRCQLAKYATKMGFKYKYSRNDSRYITAYCSELDKEGCKWYVKGGIDTINKSSFVIRRANLRHTCTLSVMGNGSHRLGANILGTLVQEKVQNNPKLSATQIRDHLLNDYGLDVTYEQVWRGLEVAKANVLGFGSYKDSYTELHWYKSAILKTNPGSHVTLETEEDKETHRFKRFFVAFQGSLHGFEKCRPMLFIDATSLKKRCKGTFLSATAKDGNDGIFPVAFAIVDSENGNNWIWFLSMLRDVVKHEKEIIYLSDRAGGLLAAFNMVWERPLHFFCLDHLMKYLRGMYKGKKYSDVFKNKMCKLLKDAAYASNPGLFSTAIAEFQRQGGEITGQFLIDLPVEKWALAFAPDLLRYGEFKSNDEESVNNWILDACSSPITYVLDRVSTQLVKLFLERREEQRKWTGALTPRMEEMWNALDMLSSSWMISSTTFEGVFSVLSRPPCTVDLNRQICSCYEWQITGFPCCHAVACIKQAGWNIRGVVDASFLSDTYRLIYESDIEAIPPTAEKNEYMELNTNQTILPPVIRKDQEKPSKKRKPSKGEEKQVKIRCGRCGEFGTHHYWVTCMDA